MLPLRRGGCPLQAAMRKGLKQDTVSLWQLDSALTALQAQGDHQGSLPPAGAPRSPLRAAARAQHWDRCLQPCQLWALQLLVATDWQQPQRLAPSSSESGMVRRCWW